MREKHRPDMSEEEATELMRECLKVRLLPRRCRCRCCRCSRCCTCCSGDGCAAPGGPQPAAPAQGLPTVLHLHLLRGLLLA